MLERFIEKKHTIDRLRSSPFAEHLDGFAAAMFAAGYSRSSGIHYDHLYATGDIVEVNCWAHSRRYFFKALDSDPERAKVALGFIGALFRIERTLSDSPRRKKRRSATNDRDPSSTRSSRGATPRPRRSSTTHPSPTASDMPEISAWASLSFSTTADCLSTTT